MGVDGMVAGKAEISGPPPGISGRNAVESVAFIAGIKVPNARPGIFRRKSPAISGAAHSFFAILQRDSRHCNDSLSYFP